MFLLLFFFFLLLRPPRGSTLFPSRRSSDLRGPRRAVQPPGPARTAPRAARAGRMRPGGPIPGDRKSTRLNSSHQITSYAVFCLKKKIIRQHLLGVRIVALLYHPHSTYPLHV